MSGREAIQAMLAGKTVRAGEISWRFRNWFERRVDGGEWGLCPFVGAYEYTLEEVGK